MTKRYSIFAGKAVRFAARLRGGGSALPGLFVEKIDKNFIADTLAQLPMGVVVVSGTNGKTTTTKIVVELLEGQGLRVFTNRTGSNFSRGVAAALLSEVNHRGKLNADIAVLELDEAHAVHFVRHIPPTYSLLLNVLRDQLDRFGEIDATAGMLRQIAASTRNIVVINREDSRLVNATDDLVANKEYYGVDTKLAGLFGDDDSIHDKSNIKVSDIPVTTLLTDIDKPTYELNGATVSAKLQLRGLYNVYNSAAAIALVRAVLGDKLNIEKLTNSLENIRPAFGRGERLRVGDSDLELVLVKNPSGFQLALQSFDPGDTDTMIAINDDYADGRDVSWLWDVDFDSLRGSNISDISGVRAYDMALRLEHDDIQPGRVDVNLKRSLKKFVAGSSKSKRIYCTYTAMLAIRRELSKITKIEDVS